ncbi:hypothetical protein SLEP1_g38339 [Rubroshorea leprosula]|nr:hypothetical protein SLEP1_g38339 [Rubroshorea leprosula]
MLRVNSFASSLSSCAKIPSLLIHRYGYRPAFGRLLNFPSYLFRKTGRVSSIRVSYLPINTRTHLCTAAATMKSPANENHKTELSGKAKRKRERDLPENVLKGKLSRCSKGGNLVEALSLYDEARTNGVPLSQHHYNILLYLCSSSGSSSDESSGSENGDGVNELKNLGLKRGFEIFQQMVVDEVCPNEATFTSLARLAVAKEDPEMAFDLVKQMNSLGIPSRLRSYGPALFGFCKEGNADKCYEVDAHMTESGVIPEEPELSALVKVSADTRKADKVYEMLHRMRASIRQVSEPTLEIIEDWFKSDLAGKVGAESWDVNEIKEGVVRGGGGWHGQGWLGRGKWKVVRTQVDKNGVCHSCGERLVCIDIDPKETEDFASKLSELACEREVRADFKQFQEWLQQHGPFDAVVDGANVGLINLHYFHFRQLKDVVNKLHQMSPSKRLPLVILHRNRVTGGPARDPNNMKLLESWKKSGALYATPFGSNDDWYWLYAAVSNKCLLVSNDEMRDHLFQLLGTSFFPRWKEKHQVRLSVSGKGLELLMPPPYSNVIQESECGSWHVPTITGDDLETPRLWLCATRSRAGNIS